MESKIARAIGMKYSPVAVVLTNEKPLFGTRRMEKSIGKKLKPAQTGSGNSVDKSGCGKKTHHIKVVI